MYVKTLITIPTNVLLIVLDTVRADLIAAETGLTSLNREITRLSDRLDSLRFGLAWAVRNAPMLDALNPSLRIRQAVMNTNGRAAAPTYDSPRGKGSTLRPGTTISSA